MFHTIRWRIALPYVILILLAMLGLTAYISDQVRKAHLADLEAQLLSEARLVADGVAPLLAGGVSADALDTPARHWSALVEARVTIIAADGTVLGESHEDRTQMDNHLHRPEVQQALATGQGSRLRFSQTVGYEMMYVAVPVMGDGRVIGIARVALPLHQIEANVARLRETILAATLVTALLAVVLALLIAERTARPVRHLTQVARRMAEGDPSAGSGQALRAHLFTTSRDEVGQLTRAFNHMAEQLHEKVTTLAEERSRLAAVLNHMADGAIITDGDGRVKLINPAAARLLGTAESAALGLSFAQAVRHHRLIELWQRCRERGEEQVEAVELDRQDVFLQAIVTPFLEAESQGYLVILQDLTQIRRLETVRRDFISNISHELRTPLAGLKALVDTLRDGALDDPPAAQRFLDRIETEVDALTQMVQELLELSRIESGRVPLRLAPVAVADVVLPPLERLRPQAERAELQLTVDLAPGLPPLLADTERIQQVITNLVHNALKFTPAGGKVAVRAYAIEDDRRPLTADRQVAAVRDLPLPAVVIEVLDTGVGIPADDLPRIFERFYKADRARSGGGTGLGLAIAKHIVQGHGGRIWAESVEGKGSTFYVALPITKR